MVFARFLGDAKNEFGGWGSCPHSLPLWLHACHSYGLGVEISRGRTPLTYAQEIRTRNFSSIGSFCQCLSAEFIFHLSAIYGEKDLYVNRVC